MRLALIVTTYERPDALARVLETVRDQHRPPDELVVADDGSGPATRAVVERFARRAPCPVVHSWQPDQGWRLARSRNLALARSRSEYVIFVDGDMLLDLDYNEDSRAQVDMNLVMTGKGELVEIQGTGEEAPFSRDALDQMISLATKGIRELSAIQEVALGKDEGEGNRRRHRKSG